jgi:tryptophan-rich sensory protein
MTVTVSSYSKAWQAFGLVAWALVTLVAAAIAALASWNAPEFYAQLALPSWAPPSWVFGPVWSTLYALMAIAAWLVWHRQGFTGTRTALVLFGVQLAANALWSWLFFGWHFGALAFADVLVLWCMIVATIVAFQRVRPLAGVLLYPYFVWCTFAAALTFVVWRMNPELL